MKAHYSLWQQYIHNTNITPESNMSSQSKQEHLYISTTKCTHIYEDNFLGNSSLLIDLLVHELQVYTWFSTIDL